MSAFPTAGHLASWARTAPRVSESAGKRKGKNATGRGNPYIGGTLGEASISTGRTQTFLGAQYRRMCKRMPKMKAQGAIMRKQLVIARALLSDPRPDTKTSALTTTNAGKTPTAAPAATSASWNASATRSPSRPPTPPPENSSPPASRTPRTPAQRQADGTNRRRPLPPARLTAHFRISYA